ncbi:Beta-ketoacyl synthase [Niveomyces insectorum RCEF 264]|uniref:Beta-ketoacyl synthase n=1 Tax=Niveomyces insectorum RCEF 264 TaxID=1081102 RepID=A0A167T890_9HYPO|nr:Beta-ketoacyl synthase [Niveomyces insectorum RCEF 264]
MSPSVLRTDDSSSGSGTETDPASTNYGANGSARSNRASRTNGTSNGGSHANGAGSSADGPPAAGAKFDPVAIVGMSCRLPGSVSDPEEFYLMCSRGRDGWVPVPEDRFSKKGYYHPNPDKLGCFNPVGGFFLAEDIAAFDAPFFNITEKEAISMDPQHRLILECTYEALENAGIPRHKLIGKNVGVYAGGSFTDYELNNLRDVDTCPMYQATGSAPALLSNRVSYHFDFRGPSHTIETACSSSLTALHLAMQSLQSGDSSVVVLASSHLNLVPDHFITMSTQSLLSPDGRSYAFDERANGFGRGEGAAVVILKPLSEALKDNDNIRAVVVASGVNQDGRTNGITMPNGDAQLDLMRKIYRDAGLDPTETGYVEAHGTGTKVGDPLEMKAIHRMFSEGRSRNDPLYVGSVKTNIGHLEGASGLVGIIKAAMMLERQYILPNYDFKKGNPEIPFDEWGIKVPSKLVLWPKKKKYISINSFGFGGANAHAVLAAAPKRVKTTRDWDLLDHVEPRRLFVVSANSKESLEAQMKNVTVYLEKHPPVFQFNVMPNLAYTLGERRSFLPYRVAIPASDGERLIESFATAMKAKPIRAARPPTVGFVYTGQGAQWHAMGRELFESYPVFKKSLERFDACLRGLGAKFSVILELHQSAKSSRLSDAELSQPSCTAIQIGLTDLLSDWGVRPNAVVGHSSGEIGAAYAAGVLTLEESAAIAYYRGQSVLELKAAHPGLEGRMLAVGAAPEEVWPLIKLLKNGKATVACVNSPGSITASGDSDAIAELASKIEEKQLFNRMVRVDTAYHSHHMELVAGWYGKAVGPLVPEASSDVAFYSSLRGHLINKAELNTSYWVQNLTQPVQFSSALTDMCTPKEGKEDVNVLVEIGPHSALEGPVKQILKAIEGTTKKPVYLPSLVRNKDAVDTVLDLAGSLFTHGAMLNFHAINFAVPPQTELTALKDFPRYPWDHSARYWWESRISKAHLHRPFERNDVVGSLSDYSNELEPTWRHIIRPDDVPWVRGHIMQGRIVYPMCGYLTMAVEAAAQRASTSGQAFDRFVLKDVTISRALIIQEGADTETNITLRPFTEGTRQSSKVWDEFRVFSWTQDRNWVEHCRGLIRVELSAGGNPVYDANAAENAALSGRIAEILTGSVDPVDPKDIYKELEDVTAKYTPQFQSMEKCKASDTTCVADVVVPNTSRGMPKGHEPQLYIHPAFLDQFTHAAWVILGAGRGNLHTLYMPRHFKSLTISTDVCRTPGDRIRVYGEGKANYANPEPSTISMFATSLDGTAELINMEGLTLDPLMENDGLTDQALARELCYKLAWEPLAAAQDAEAVVPDATEVSPEFPDNITIVCTPEQQGALASTVQDRFHLLSKSDVALGTFDEAKFDGKICVVLVELDRPLLATLDAGSFAQVQKLAQVAKGILWVVRGAHTDSTDPRLGMILGLARTVRSESGLKFATLDLDGANPLSANETAQTIFDVAHKVFGQGASVSPDMEFQERGGSLSVCRVVEDSDTDAFVEQHTNPATNPFPQPFKQPGRPLKLHVGTKGALDTLHFVDDTTVATPLAPDEVSIEVAVTSMNFKDIMVSMGEVPSPYLGVEVAGIISGVGNNVTDFKIGDRVCASSEGAYSTYTRCKATSVARVPDNMSLEAAATIPVVFCTAYYSLFDVARIQRGESVLIHAAAGGVGQAAIMLCQMLGAEIYVTVGSQAKKSFLIETYGIAEDRIFFSRDTTFAKGIQQATQGRGVDVVLNSLAGDSLRATWECIAHFGRFVEIGKRDILSNSGLGMAEFENNATFASVDLTVLAMERPLVMRRVLDDVFRLLGYGLIKPISPTTVMPISNIEAAFRALQSGKVHGKILVTGGSEDMVKATYSEKAFDGILRGDATYVIIGGTGGIGRSITNWMAGRGAKSIVLVSRSETISPKVAEVIQNAAALGVKVIVRRCDVSNSQEVESMVAEISAQLPPVRGVVHSAMVLDDVLFEKMNFDQWEKVVQSKVAGCWNVHTALSNAKLDFFIALSSVAGIIGNRGQAAYAAANTFLDALVQHRRHLGLAATALDLAAVSDTGYLAENAERQKLVMDQLGGEAISEKEILALVAASITGRAEETCQSQVITGLKLPAEFSNVFWASDSKFTALCSRAASENAGGAETTQAVSPGVALKRATSYAEAYGIVIEGLLDKTAAVLMLPREELEPTKATSFYGLDSLVSIEIRNWITREFGAALTILDLLSSGSFVALADMVLGKTELVSFEKPT